MSAFGLLIVRDLRLAVRQGGAFGMTLAFFVLAITLFPLGVGPEQDVLRRIAPGVLWVALLLASLLTLDRLFQADFEDGTLDLFPLAPLPLEAVVLAKCCALWATSSAPLILLSPVLALMMQMPVESLPVLLLAMLIGTPALVLIGAVGAALTLSVRRGGMLLPLLVLPLYVPVLIFGVAAVDAVGGGLSARAHLMLLGAISIVALVLAPLASAAAIRLGLE